MGSVKGKSTQRHQRTTFLVFFSFFLPPELEIRRLTGHMLAEHMDGLTHPALREAVYCEPTIVD